MNITVTGANGFLGKNLINHLIFKKNINIFKVTRKTSNKELKKYLLTSDVIYHFAAINRPGKGQSYSDNIKFTEKIFDFLRKSNKKIKVIFSSSTQVWKKTAYGLSKKACEKIIINYAKNTKSKIFIFRFPNIYGKWSRPNYNSVVSTFCYNISRNKKISISEPNKIINLAYIDDVIQTCLDLLIYRSTIKKYYYNFDNFNKISLINLFKIIKEFYLNREKLFLSDMSNILIKNLYSTYISFLPKHKIAYKIKSYKDYRGIFIEFLKTKNNGQISIFTAKKNILRGKHFHHSKVEKFFVLNGRAKFVMRDLITNKVIKIFCSSKSPMAIESVPGCTHYIQNIGKEDLTVLLWSNEIYNAKKPDTIYYE
jgi:UDP-2-acetamido-2,6-beta-L-arabino-hexul-4-ose reductase